METCSKCGEEKAVHAKCNNCGAKVCATCFDGFSNCPGCDNGDLNLV